MVGMYAIYHGPKGLKQIGERINSLTQIFASFLSDFGFEIVNYNKDACQFFDTIAVKVEDSDKYVKLFEKN